MKIPAKFFPFAARQPLWDMAKKHGKMKYSIVAIWEYMFWRSGKKNLFELADDLVCLDLGCDTHTLCGVRKVLQAEGWLKKESLRDKGGKWLTRGWTVVINLAPTCAKSPSGEDQPHGHEPHGHQPHVDVPHADQPHVVDYTALYPPTPVILQHSNPTSSSNPSVSVQVSKQASQSASDSVGSSKAALLLTDEEKELLAAILPVRDVSKDGKYKTVLASILAMGVQVPFDPLDLLEWNRKVKKGGLYIRTPDQFLKSIIGDAESSPLLNQYVIWRNVATKSKPKTDAPAGRGFRDACAGCGWHKDDCTCKEGDEPVAVGTGFDEEEA
jgi:hypothetical protein